MIWGYSDLAIYSALAVLSGKLLGYKVIYNFNKPFLATNIADYWQRWHITLSSWARDYVFFPVLISSKNRTIALVLTMLTIGLWHSLNLNWFIFALSHSFGIYLYLLIKDKGFFVKLKKKLLVV